MESGSPVSLIQLVDVPGTPTSLTFDYAFVTTAGSLSVSLNGMLIGTYPAPSPLASTIESASILVDQPFLGLQGVELEFTMDAPLAGAPVLIDNIQFPGLVNGTFETGDLSGYTTTTSGEGLVGVSTGGILSVPALSGIGLALLGSLMSITAFLRTRRR